MLQVSNKVYTHIFCCKEDIISSNTFGDACRYGTIPVEQFATFKGAADEINERVLCVESIWKRITMQLDFLQKVWKTLDEEHQDIQNRILQVLVSKVQAAIFQLERVQKKKKKKGKDAENNNNVVKPKKIQIYFSQGVHGYCDQGFRGAAEEI